MHNESFHQMSLDLLEAKLPVGPRLQQKVDFCSQLLDLMLPESFVEWYSYVGAVEILKEYSNDDRPLSLDEIIDFSDDRSGYVYWKFESRTIIPLIVENQVGQLWCIDIDGSEDPPVGYFDSENNWFLCYNSLSNFIFDRIWENYGYDGKRYTFNSQSPGADKNTLKKLEGHIWRDFRIYNSGIAHFDTELTHVAVSTQTSKPQILFHSKDMDDLLSTANFLRQFFYFDVPL
jgi:hypothetical protein